MKPIMICHDGTYQVGVIFSNDFDDSVEEIFNTFADYISKTWKNLDKFQQWTEINRDRI